MESIPSIERLEPTHFFVDAAPFRECLAGSVRAGHILIEGTSASSMVNTVLAWP